MPGIAETPGLACPGCSEILRAHASLEGEAPEAGDVTFCAHCGEVLRFEDATGIGLELVRQDPATLSDEEIGALMSVASAVRWKRRP